MYLHTKKKKIIIKKNEEEEDRILLGGIINWVHNMSDLILSKYGSVNIWLENFSSIVLRHYEQNLYLLQMTEFWVLSFFFFSLIFPLLALNTTPLEIKSPTIPHFG